METYFKFKFITKFIIPVILIMLVILYLVYSYIKFKLNQKFKKNCFKCKHYSLFDVASCGDGCRYKCNKNNNINHHGMNDHYNFVKCKEFESK